MAVPFKNGADLYNNEVLRMRLHNLGADPTEVGAGLIYFNTSNGLNTSKKARIWTGDAWKTFAFVEDLDVASNADFIALQEKVDTLIGDGVDMDGIIESWKEVEAFLSGMSDTKSLMDLLNDKLSLSQGGRMGASKAIAWGSEGTNSYIFGDNNGLYISASKLQRRTADAKYYDILDTRGGTISNASNEPLSINNTTTGGGCYIDFLVENKIKGFVGYSSQDMVFMQLVGGSYLAVKKDGAYYGNKTLLHSGNVGEYAVKGLNIQTSSDNTRSLFSVWRGNTDADGGDGYVMDFNWNSGNYKAQIYIDVDPTHKMALRQCGNDGIWSDWKTIAFTDSNENITFANEKGVAGTTVEGQKYTMLYLSNANNLLLGFHTSLAGISTKINGKNVYLNYGENHTTGILLNSSGNVTIGASNLAGTSRKLFVSGGSAFFVNTQSNITTTDQLDRTKTFTISAANEDTYNYGLHVWIDPSGRSNLQSSYAGLAANKSTYPIALNPLGGNVLIGTITELNSGSKLQVKGDLYVEGNIIASKEVSAGGAGEEGSGSGSGAGAFHSESIAVGATQTTIAHGLGTDDIVVSIYEKDATSGLWSMILTDIEITDANNIRVTFGSATTVEHKVVIMGAVA